MEGKSDYQVPLFTHGGQPYTKETQRDELRLDVLRHLAECFGVVEIPTVACPDCGGTLKVVRLESSPAWCECGFYVDLKERDRR